MQNNINGDTELLNNVATSLAVYLVSYVLHKEFLYKEVKKLIYN